MTKGGVWAAGRAAKRPRNPAPRRQRLRQLLVNELEPGGYGLRVTRQCLTYSTAPHRVWSMRTAALAISLYALILAVVAGATWLGNGGHYGIDAPRVEQAATLEQAPSSAPCTTDAECDVYAFRAGWDVTPTLVPSADGGEGYVCPAGHELYDTEQPALGASGVVCRNVFMQT